MLIDTKRYFILHAPRQTGKTSTLLAMMETINQGDEYKAIYSNIESAQAARGDLTRGIPEIARAICADAEYYLNDFVPRKLLHVITNTVKAEGLIAELLARWCQASDKPLVLLLDEVDALVGDTLISLLRQLRAGYNKRPRAFPISVILCGVRDV
ncbi:AAA family ATPase, partial [Desulfamplus magnetovallimortis]|uniref:AAA family ATPase n=1 Tax=Desulfamplus magnetovallimortis TaxID=1246637 RepID=UPI00111A86CC